jgi:hypothetical protein
VAVEHNAAPERLDLNDRDLRLAKELGCKIVINSDSHDARNLGKMEYGIRQLRRAWLGPEDVLNTLAREYGLFPLRTMVKGSRQAGRLKCGQVSLFENSFPFGQLGRVILSRRTNYYWLFWFRWR